MSSRVKYLATSGTNTATSQRIRSLSKVVPVSESVRELLGDVSAMVKAEWDSRTTYGKVCFPAWLLFTMSQLTFLWLLFTVGGGLKGFTEGSSEPMFEVYEDDE